MINKIPVELTCTECNTKVRLWLPMDVAPVDETGLRVLCVKCGAKYSVVKEGKNYNVKPYVAPAGSASSGSASSSSAGSSSSKSEAPKANVEITDTILMIEDDKVARAMAESQLLDAGIKALMAKNSKEALNIIKTQKVSLIVTDLHLKNPNDPDAELDGEELLRKIIGSGINVPAIITTGKDVLDDLIMDPKWFDLNVKGFIQKGNPFWVEELKLKIKEILYRD